jgi:hypothetical protein
MPKQPRVYGTPVGIAGGPSEKPSQSTDRKAVKPATDTQVHETIKADAAYRHGREAPPRSASDKAVGNAPPRTDEPKGVIDALKNRGKRIDRAVDESG